MRFFVGVGKFTPNNVVAGKMAWIPPDIHQWKSVISHWARLCNKPTPRLNKRIAIWEDSNASRSYKTWYFVVKDKLLSYNINTHTDLNSNVSKYNIIKELYDKMMSLYTYRLRACIIKTESISGRCRNKLWNYCKCNTEYKVEHYCKIILALKHWSALSAFMYGVASIRIETGRYELWLKMNVYVSCVTSMRSSLRSMF